MFNLSLEILINHIDEIKSRISDYKKSEDENFVANSIAQSEKEILEIERAIIALKHLEHKTLRKQKDVLRRKAMLRNDSIQIKTITKGDKVYAIVPIEILPKYLHF